MTYLIDKTNLHFHETIFFSVNVDFEELVYYIFLTMSMKVKVNF